MDFDPRDRAPGKQTWTLFSLLAFMKCTSSDVAQQDWGSKVLSHCCSLVRGTYMPLSIIASYFCSQFLIRTVARRSAILVFLRRLRFGLDYPPCFNPLPCSLPALHPLPIVPTADSLISSIMRQSQDLPSHASIEPLGTESIIARS